MSESLATEKLNLCMPPDMKGKLHELRGATGCTSLAELVRRSFNVYEILYREVMGGGRVILEDDDGNQRLLIVPEFEVRKDEE